MTFQSELESVLTDLVECSVDSSKQGYSKAYEYAAEAKEAITTLVLETLGEDEFEPIYRPNPDRHDIASDDRLRIRDSLRDELRTKFTNPEKEE